MTALFVTCLLVVPALLFPGMDTINEVLRRQTAGTASEMSRDLISGAATDVRR